MEYLHDRLNSTVYMIQVLCNKFDTALRKNGFENVTRVCFFALW